MKKENSSLRSLKLCLVTNSSIKDLDSYLQLLQKAISGGVTSVQFRDKTNSLETIRKTAFILKEFLSPLQIPLIINDHVALAKEVQAEGAHIGQSDLSPKEARRILGPDTLLGLSIDSLNQLHEANQLTVIDYLGLGAIFPSQSKKDCKTIWGLQGLKQAVSLTQHPLIAIGGITQDNAQAVMTQGASGIAVISAIHDHEDPKLASSELIQAIHKGYIYERTN